MKYFLKNFFIIGLTVGFLFGAFFIYISRDVSLEYNIWINAGSRDSYNKYDYVRFKYNKPDKYISGKWLIKQITCSSGDTLLLHQGNIITCNGKVISKTLNKARNGDSLQPLSFTGVIPEGYYFIQGTHERSYDSRYFGLIHVSEISKKVIPLRSLLVW